MGLPPRSCELTGNTKPSVPGLTLSAKASFVIETNLCNTKLTQDVDLLGLLHWSSHKETLAQSLNSVPKRLYSQSRKGCKNPTRHTR